MENLFIGISQLLDNGMKIGTIVKIVKDYYWNLNTKKRGEK